MTWKLVASDNEAPDASGSTISFTVSQAPPGSLLLWKLFTRATSITGTPDGASLAVEELNGTDNDVVAIYYQIAGNAAGTTFSFTTSESDRYAGRMEVWTADGIIGLLGVASTPFDTSVSSIDAGPVSVPPAQGQGARVLLGAVAAIRGTVTSPSIDGGYTLDAHLVGGTSSVATALEATLSGAAEGTHDPTFSWTTSRSAMGLQAAFVESLGSDTAPRGAIQEPRGEVPGLGTSVFSRFSRLLNAEARRSSPRAVETRG
jgi:hypothetical protein